ncbi:MAG: galactose-1-phosphate uridylyltransferase, partial [Bacilli bacterium]|nr:galactose-1-phosphate uridylyltransferase [Bacilli bacterium]
PIVGGSILNHEHFQGGKEILPLLRAPIKRKIETSDYGAELFEVDFYHTCLVVIGEDKGSVAALAEKIRKAWRSHNDEENGIIAKTGDGVEHNTLTPIVRKFGKEYRLYLVLRNNRCDKDYPDGIFHAHREYFHIKSEGIGLIEASGLFVLPARLKRQGKAIEKAVGDELGFNQAQARYKDLSGFKDMYDSLAGGTSMERYMAEVCRKILINVSVYKKDEKGRAGLNRFLEEALS